MRKLLLAIALLIGGVGTSTAVMPAIAVASSLQLFTTESAAQHHCPHDMVVWLNTASGIYHLKGERWYGNTKHGAYVCKKEADAAGDRETENGQ
jgi:hypothetical protein